MEANYQRFLRKLPKIDEVMSTSIAQKLEEYFPRTIIVDLARQAVDELRTEVLSGKTKDVSLRTVGNILAHKVFQLTRPSLHRVVNASGVVIHTNLGRSVLAKEAADAVQEVARGYSTLEYDVNTMARGSRHDHCERLLTELTGAEAALAVNNNAAAVMMVLTAFASAGESIVSRGELIEIGGSFRIPDIMEQSGTQMVEVGTTNKTHRIDYERAISNRTAMLLKVHPSNYRMLGFTESVDLTDLRQIADEENARRAGVASFTDSNKDKHTISNKVQPPHGLNEINPVLVYEDQGSGTLIHLSCFGEYAEPTVAESLRKGADLVSFSGDKLLGGPQAGIIVGRKVLIEQLKSHPLARVLRLDKMTLAALEATLRLYLNEDVALRKIPTLRMLTEDAEDVRRRAENLKERLKGALPTGCVQLDVIPEIARAGGGALPMCGIDTYAVRVTFMSGDALSCERHLIQKRSVPIICRIKKETVLLDARTLTDESDLDEIVCAFVEYFTTLEAKNIHGIPSKEA